jgi:hypothetical protein
MSGWWKTGNIHNYNGKLRKMGLTAAQITELANKVESSKMIHTIEELTTFTTRYSGLSYENSLAIATMVSDMFREIGVADIVNPYYMADITSECDSRPTPPNPPFYSYAIHTIAEIKGTLYPDKYLIITAHADSISKGEIESNSFPDTPAPGVGDDACGVAAMIEIARIILESGYKPDITIRFCVFAGEEIAMAASSGAYSDECDAKGEDIALVLTLDGISLHDKTAPKTACCLYPYDTDTDWYYRDRTIELMKQYSTITTVTIYQTNVARSDNWGFYLNGCKSVYLEEDSTGVGAAIVHSADDNMEHYDAAYALEMTKGALACICEFAGVHSSTVTVTINETTTVKAKAFKRGLMASDVVEEEYIIL